jgi:WD40 repeat protein
VGAADAVSSLAFSPGGGLLAAASSDGSVHIWDTSSRAERRPIVPDGGQAVWALTWSPDGRTLATGGAGRAIRFWDVADGSARGAPVLGAGDWLTVAFAPDGRRLAAAGTDGSVRVWPLVPTGDAAAGEGARLREGGRPVPSLAFSPDGRRLAGGSSDATITLWDVSGRPRRLRTLGVRSVAFSPDGRTVVSGADDGGVRLWDVATGQPIGGPLAGHHGPVQSVAFAPDGHTAFSGGDDRQVVAWDVDLQSWSARACGIADRNLVEGEWHEVGGHGHPPVTCPVPR